MSLSPTRAAAAAGAAVAVAVAAVAALGVPSSSAAPADAPTFTRVNIGASIPGASFTSVGEVFDGEQDIVTSGYGSLDAAGRPVGGGTLQILRPGDDLTDWHRLTVFDATAGIVFPNAPAIEDVDGDGDRDVIVPSGHFFGTDPQAASQLLSGAITWWENTGPASAFVRHDVIAGQPGSYHGVQLADLDGDGILDLLSVSEEARNAGDLNDDTVTTQFFKGRADHTFAAPVALADGVGGSQPVVHDVDGDGDPDVVTAQYFHLLNTMATSASFAWLENRDDDGDLHAADFTAHAIASFLDVGMGFQIRPVPDFHGPGTLAWIGTNHVNRCTLGAALPIFDWPEQVIEFTPGDDVTQPWSRTTLSDPGTAAEPCPASYKTYPDPELGDRITSRYGFGQGAPGVFGYGDLDGDGDVDLAVSGDGDRRLWWIENLGSEGTALHRLTAAGDYFGQAGGAVVTDLDGDGANEAVFSSFDRNTLALWRRDAGDDPAGDVVRVPSSLRVGPESRTVRAGARTTWSIRFSGAPGGDRRTVTVVFDPTRGKTVRIGTVRLRTTATATAGVQRGSLTWRPRSNGRVIVEYAGSVVSPTLRDLRTRDTATVRVR